MTGIVNWMGGWPREGLISASDWEERLAAAADRYRFAGSPGPAGPRWQERVKEVLSDGLLAGKTQRHPERLKLTRGADAALQLLASRSLSEGDIVLVDRLTSRTALQIFRKAGARIEAVDGDEQGMDPGALKRAISRHKPRLVYTAPGCSDPQGKVWSRERTRAVLAACRAARVTALRDDRQEMLVYDDMYGGGSGSTAAAGDDRAASMQAGVLSVGQLPPGLIAGFRFGWIAGRADDLDEWLPELPLAPGAAHLDTAVLPLECQALANLLQEQPLAEHLDMLRVQCRARMRRVAELLAERPLPPPGLQWQNPAGGMHLWLALPPEMDSQALLRAAWLKGLMFQPGMPYYAADPQPNTLRITFAGSDERQLKLGTQRLLETIGDFLGRSTYGSR